MNLLQTVIQLQARLDRSGHRRALVVALTGLLCVISSGRSDEPAPSLTWPQFRGAMGGVSADSRPPVDLSPAQVLKWKIDLPPGHSSPIVVSGRVFLDAADKSSGYVFGIDLASGQVLWKSTVPFTQAEKVHNTNTRAPCTPASDGTNVYSYLPGFGLVAHDLNGAERWRHSLDLPKTFMNQGSGSSPVVAGGLVLVDRQLSEDSHLLAVDAATGREVWRAPRPLNPRTWATPVVWQWKGKSRVGLVSQGRFTAYDLATGQEIWWVSGLGPQDCATPVVQEERILISSAGIQGDSSNMTLPPSFDEAIKVADPDGDGIIQVNDIPSSIIITDRKTSDGAGNLSLKNMIRFFYSKEAKDGLDREKWSKMTERIRAFRDGAPNRPNFMAVRLGGNGDVTKTHVLWQDTKGVPEVPSPLVFADHVYLIRSGGLLNCRQLSDGKTVYDERIGAPGGYYASPVAANGHIYLASDRGTITVVQAGDTFSVAARHELGEPVLASPALAGNILLIRGKEHLWAFAN